MSTDPTKDRFRGPTPPPAVDREVLAAAAAKAQMLSGDGESRLSEEGQKSYSNSLKQKQDSTEQNGMSDNIVFPCPACGSKYSVGPHHAGKKTTCKKCGAPITVPTPQVANPTIVGGTRTIRRADIDPGASAREEAVEERATSVDMTGGASVLRKEETVIGHAPDMSDITGTRPAVRGPRPGGRPTGGPATGGRGAPPPARGRPMPPGAGAPKKSNTPLVIGAVGGGVGLVLLVVLIVVFTGDPKTTTDDGGDAVAQDGGEEGPKVGDDERLLKQMGEDYNNHMVLNLDECLHYYKESKARADNPDFKAMQIKWQEAVAKKAKNEPNSEKMAEIALLLDDDGYSGSKALLQQAAQAMEDAEKATRTVEEMDQDTGRKRKRLLPNPLFKKVVERIGWKPYSRPAAMDDYVLYEVEGATEYSIFYNRGIKQVYNDVGLYPPDKIEKLNSLEKVAKESYDELAAKDASDGFAFNARKAFIRFRNANRAGKVDRTKNQRSFSPVAMERENEEFDSIWTYSYWKPFIVYIEKPIGQDDLDEEFIETLESKSALLKHLHDWFRKNLIDEFNLQRVKPQYNAKLAEQEGWPLEVVVMKDAYTFEKFVGDESGGNPIPGARALYSPLEERVLTYDDRENSSDDTQWFNESVLIHECFHMLSDFYTAEPMFKMEEIQQRPRYLNILVQEGLTDSVSGFIREGVGRDATYEFLELNHLRLRSFQNIYKLLNDRPLFRIQDMLRCRHYGQCNQVAMERARELGVNPLWAGQNGTGIFYPTACQASYFFHHYKKGGKYPYRDKWWEYIGSNYTGETILSSYADNRGIAKFKEVFEIEGDEDFDALNKEWLDYIMALDPEDVGKSGGGEVEGPAEESREARDVPPPPRAVRTGAKSRALPGREED